MKRIQFILSLTFSCGYNVFLHYDLIEMIYMGVSFSNTFLSHKTHVAFLHFNHIALIRHAMQSSTPISLKIIDPGYLKLSFGCKTLSSTHTSISSLIGSPQKLHHRYFILAMLIHNLFLFQRCLSCSQPNIQLYSRLNY